MEEGLSPPPPSNPSRSCSGRIDGPIPTLDEVLECQISSWYPAFAELRMPQSGGHDGNSHDGDRRSRRRTRATVRTIIVDLPDEFFERYLLSDGLHLPRGATTASSFLPATVPDDDDVRWSSSDDDEADPTEGDTGDGGVESATSDEVSFPELDRRIEEAIEELKGGNESTGAVAPKLNWSSPKDAVWLNAGTLKCQSSGDVYLLLKASDFCLYDVQHALSDVRDRGVGDRSSNDGVVPPPACRPFPFRLQLALRKWCNLYPSQEFRCFVRGHELIGISQRHHSQHFPHLSRDRFVIRLMIIEFFDEIVHNRFASGRVANYVFDAYIDKKEKVWIVDFNVWGTRTDPLMFEWSELVAMDAPDALPEIRVVETDKQVRADPLSSYRAPIDCIHVASVTGGISAQFEEFMKQCERPSALDTENDSASSEYEK